MLEPFVGQTRRQGDASGVRVGFDFKSHEIERINAMRCEIFGPHFGDFFARTAQSFKNDHARAAEPAVHQEL
ncbi:MAG: hypothetical protein Q8K85_10525, partial [Hyphomicrobium sp.]|nr:hypothetical protein [Hyphomicrobium sp.]